MTEKYKIFLRKFETSDLSDLERIIEYNRSAAGTRNKDWKKFIEWNMTHEDDLYWKIVNHKGIMVGYIGYDDATRKLTTKELSKKGDLFLEIYLDPEYTGKGIGCKAFNKSLSLIPDTCERIFASTYISNTNAHRFFGGKIGMVITKFDETLGVTVFEYKIDRKLYVFTE